ncbi:MAG TPA: hypothetical protein VE999_13005 [Gemmataceae bacterium]|nr:hypothetical protein [Gemmataceae bacterium]
MPTGSVWTVTDGDTISSTAPRDSCGALTRLSYINLAPILTAPIAPAPHQTLDHFDGAAASKSMNTLSGFSMPSIQALGSKRTLVLRRSFLFRLCANAEAGSVSASAAIAILMGQTMPQAFC